MMQATRFIALICFLVLITCSTTSIQENFLQCQSNSTIRICTFDDEVQRYVALSKISGGFIIAKGSISAFDCKKNGFTRSGCKVIKKAANKSKDKVTLFIKRSLSNQLTEVLQEQKDRKRQLCLESNIKGRCIKWILWNPLNDGSEVDLILKQYHDICLSAGKKVVADFPNYMTHIVFTCVEKDGGDDNDDRNDGDDGDGGNDSDDGNDGDDRKCSKDN
ncbi:hypothetical protein CANMA_004040 [Candida margitis]|uniref:uncharacterized protein n=1 Tax=Candida margitis TaxID=1775924 RepID=UPI0022267EA8|nr:uncharacterized protein CANMA_004040 [Candida margitis]KAI5960260.1 hypothetical protein CANMA_004040 [Candida margitis]